MTKQSVCKALVMVVATTLLAACRGECTTEQAEMIVTIAPLKYIVEQITADDFHIGVLLPAGASPETYDPTPRQINDANNAKLLFTTGLIEFEKNIVKRLDNQAHVVSLSHGIDLIEGNHTHHNALEKHNHSHRHGTDPHIWTSPQELKIMARNAYEAIMKEYPDSIKYSTAYSNLVAQLELLDNECSTMCKQAEITAFIIYHPALSYFARAYDIKQIAIENNGNQPSAKHIADIIMQARAGNIKSVLYQVQYPRSVIEVIADDINVEPYQIDPLTENVVDNIRRITQIITGNYQ